MKFVERTTVDPWADDPRLRAADGTALTESLFIVQGLEHTRPAPSLLVRIPFQY